MPAASDATATLQRQILGAIGRVLDLVKSRKRLNETSIHQIRKELKLARAALRLIRDAVAATDFDTVNALLRDASRPLASARDTTVLINTLRDVSQTDTGRRHRIPLARARRALHQPRFG